MSWAGTICLGRRIRLRRCRNSSSSGSGRVRGGVGCVGFTALERCGEDLFTIGKVYRVYIKSSCNMIILSCAVIIKLQIMYKSDGVS